MERKRWEDMTESQRRGLVVGAVVQLSLAAAAWTDLARRPADRVRGPKGLWAAVIAVNFVGPVLWFTVGRRCDGCD